MNLVVDERKSSDEVVHTIESRGYKVLAIVTEKLKNGKHSKTSVLKLVKLALLKLLGLKVGLSELEVSKESPVVNSSNG